MIKYKKIINILTIMIMCTSIVIYFLGITLAGANIIDAIKYILSFNLMVLAGGFFSEKIFNCKKLGFNILMGIPLGITLAFVSFLILDSALIILPIGLYNLYVIIKEKKIQIDSTNFNISILSITFAIFLIVYAFIGVLSFAKPSATGEFLYHQDMLWSVGNAASVFNGFPFQDMRLANVTLNYHFLNDVLAGIFAKTVGVTAYDALCYYYYPSMVAYLIYATYYLSKIICENNIVSSFTPFALLFMNSAASNMHFNYLVNMNGQGSASLMLVCFLVLFSYVILEKINVKNTVLILIFSIVMSMFKSTIGALSIIAVLAASMVYKVLHKEKGITKLYYSIVSLVGFLLSNHFIFSKAVNNLVFIGADKIDTVFHVIENAPLISIIFIVSAVYFLCNIKTLSFLELAIYAGGTGGTLAYTLYKHYSFSEVYFLLVGIYFMLIGIVKPVSIVIKKRQVYKYVLAIIAIISTINTLDGIAVNASNGVRATLNILEIVQDPYDESYITNFDEEATTYLRENTEQDSIFATNRNNKYHQNGDGIFHYYTANSQRRAFIESYRYTMDYSGMYHEVVRRLEGVSDLIFFTLSESEAFNLAKEEGIDYLVVNTRVSSVDWSKTPVFENEQVSIYKV